jgi:SPP1 gp7 family putative phage head morphogenesis protein
MSYKAALDADARLAAKNALKIVAALRQTFDAKAVYEQYLTTQPNKSDNPAQDRARARAWAIMNVTPNMQAMNTVMQRVLAEGYVTGEAFAKEQLRIARELKKADNTEYVDWANWKPGDQAAALLIRPPKAFQQLLASQGIALKEMSQTTVRDIGNAIADAVDLGLSAERSAKNIMRHVASPARALSIAITEQNRAISYATVSRYKEAGLEKMEWEVSSPCDKCAKNANQVVPIGSPFNSGNTQPPAHPHCRCVLLPVIPDFDEIAATPTGTTLTPMPSDVPITSFVPTEQVPTRGYRGAKHDPDFFLSDVEGTEDRLKAMIPTKTRPDGTLIPDWSAASGGSGPENIQLKNLMKEQGFLGKPRVVGADEFEKIVSQGASPVYRGMGAETLEEVDEYVDRLLDSDDPFIGRGFFGDGTYFASDRGIAERFAESSASGDITFKFGEVIDGVIDPNARVMDIEELWRLRNEYVESMPYHGELAQAYEDDIGLFATSIGVDVIENKNPMIGYTPDGQRRYAPGSYYTVLNRSALILKGRL